jgi:hypothetical protein
MMCGTQLKSRRAAHHPHSTASYASHASTSSRAHAPAAPPAAKPGYDAFGVFGTALQQKNGVFHASPLKMAPRTPNVGVRCDRRFRDPAFGVNHQTGSSCSFDSRLVFRAPYRGRDVRDARDGPLAAGPGQCSSGWRASWRRASASPASPRGSRPSSSPR